MSDHHQSTLERVLHRVEAHIEEWRKEDAVRKREAEADRERLWAEAAERERRLAEAMSEQEAPSTEQSAVFVVHSKEAGQALRRFADEGDCLAKVVPGRTSSVAETGLEGSWLVIETPTREAR